MGADERECLLPTGSERRRAIAGLGAPGSTPTMSQSAVTVAFHGAAQPYAGSSLWPDLKPQVYKDPRPAEYFDRFHERSRTHEPDWVYDLARIILTLPAARLSAPGDRSRERSHLRARDPRPEPLQPVGPLLRRRLHPAEGSVHGQVAAVLNPLIEFIFRHGGAFPIRRGHHDEEAFKTAFTILDRGGCMLHVPRGRPLTDRRDHRAAPRRGTDRTPVGRARDPGGHPRLAGRARLAQAAVPEGDGPVRRAALLRRRRRADPRPADRGRDRQSSATSARCTRPSTPRAAAA